MKLKLSPRRKSQEPSGNDKRKQKSRQMSNLGVFITFLMISAVFWYIQSLEGTYQIRLNIPVTYDSLPGKTGYSISPPKSIEVVLTDKGLNLLDYKLKEFKPVHLEIQKGNNGQYLGISRKQLNATVMKQLSSTVQISSITPSEISIPLFRRESKKVPVHLNFEAATGQGFIAYRPQITPDSVTIYGSMEMLKNIKEVVAEDLPHEGLTASFEGELRLQPPAEGVILSFEKVSIKVPVEELTEYSFEQNIEVEGEPKNRNLLPLPARVTVNVTIPRSKYNDVNPADFRVTLQYPDDRTIQSDDTLPLVLKNQPEWVVNYTIKPERIQYVIERR